jgi:polyhydroxyalkanoate synthesis regulator protein
MFTPAGFTGRAADPPAHAEAPEPKADDLADLKNQIEAMRAQIDRLAATKA